MVTAGRPDARFLDLFAGSGSTGEAVMPMNAADGGRESVCVANNEVVAETQAELTGAGAEPG